ncbi:MAG TPA: MBL fold metallo-hydrolase [Gaiellaceae bacterium]|nr:MBL fold metallo-hydrolase [Gaiellaceae bacterium]
MSSATVSASVSVVRDTCNVYVLRTGGDAVLVDFGSGAVLDRLDELGVERVTDVLVTHHHRDQVQGLARAAAAGIRIWVPPVEEELIAGISHRWETRQLDNDYDVRQDRYSLLDDVAVTGTVDEYRTRRYGGVEVYTLPTPGHTVGSVTYLVEADGRRLAFSGDLLYGQGKVWSLAATQWTYSGVEGLAATVLSAAALLRHEPDTLLPSHGEAIDDPAAAVAALRPRLQELLDLRRGEPWDLERWLREPWVPVTPHLLRNRTSFGASYALLSESGAALLVDWGYDDATGLAWGTERTTRRPLLTSIAALRRDHGVDRVEVVVPTHFHDDHVAGINLLRDVEGTQAWAPENVAHVLEEPRHYDLPCLWFEPIPVDRRLPLGEPVAWREYELTAYPLPGHTLYAAAILVEVDGRRVLATGDQQALAGGPDGPDVLNYQYRNGFRIDDFVDSARLYRSLAPDVIVSGHWLPREITPGYLDRLLADGERLAELHRELLPLEDVDFGAGGFGARIAPYRSAVAPGGTVVLEVSVRNPFGREATAAVALAVPEGWPVPPAQEVELGAHAEALLRFELAAGPRPARRARIAADLTVDGTPFGQQAEALVDVG